MTAAGVGNISTIEHGRSEQDVHAPIGVTDQHSLRGAEEEAGVDDSRDDAHRRVESARVPRVTQSGRRSAIHDDVPVLGLERPALSGAARTVGTSPSALSRRSTRPRASGITSTGMRPLSPSRSTSFSLPTMITCRRDAAATMRSRTSAPPQPLTRSRFGATSSAPSMVRSSSSSSPRSTRGMPAPVASVADSCDVATPETRRPCRTRAPSSAMKIEAALPVPSPTRGAVADQLERGGSRRLDAPRGGLATHRDAGADPSAAAMMAWASSWIRRRWARSWKLSA